MTLNEVLKNTNYDVSLFSEEARKYVEDAIVVKTIRGKESLFIKCLKRDKEIALKPEEAVRQLYLYKLIHEYGYPTSRIEVEFPIHFGREVKRADIAIMDKDRLMVPYIILCCDFLVDFYCCFAGTFTGVLVKSVFVLIGGKRKQSRE